MMMNDVNQRRLQLQRLTAGFIKSLSYPPIINDRPAHQESIFLYHFIRIPYPFNAKGYVVVCTIALPRTILV